MMNDKKLFEQFNLIDRHGVWVDKTPPAMILAASKLAVEDILHGPTALFPTKKRRLHRLAGQSGSGKSTQLLPAVLAAEGARGNNPAVVGVRTFAPYHPEYEKLAHDGHLREKTNGFALKCLAAAVSILMERGVMLVLDMVIMGPWCEKFLLDVARENGYEIVYNILAVNIDISNGFIEKRRFDISSPECGKHVHQNSIDLWYAEMPKGLDYLAKASPNDTAFVWTVFDKEPIYHGPLAAAGAALEIGRKKTGPLNIVEKELLGFKTEYLGEFLPCI